MDSLPSTHYHSPPVEAFKRNNASIRIDLSEEGLMAQARQESGLEHFADDRFRPALGELLQSIEAEAELNVFGRFSAQSRIVRSLKNRLWADACFASHPEIRQRRIAAPLVIVGPHRSGTTRLQRMLATDSRWQYLSTWEGINPAPRPGQPELGRTARYEEARSMLEQGKQIYPKAFTAHPMQADWPEEEMLLLNHSFCSFSLLGLFTIPGYYRWFLAADKTDSYRYMADLMRLISWSRGEPEGKRWILKNPQHMLDLDVLLKVFPDAQLVFTHRDPLKTVGSMLSLVWYYAVQHTDRPCRAAIREVWVDFCEQMARRCMQMREKIPADQQHDIYYEDMNGDWRSTMRRLYRFANLELTPEAERAQADWLEESASEKLHGGHRYALEDFGITRAEVDARFRFVRERYAIPYEDR